MIKEWLKNSQNFRKIIVIILILLVILIVWLLNDPRFKNTTEEDFLEEEPIIEFGITLEEVDSLPEDNSAKYELVSDSRFPNQYISLLGENIPIVSFPQPINNFTLISSNNFIFLQNLDQNSGEFFLIDAKNPSKEKFQNPAISSVDQLIFSLSGDYFAFNTQLDPRYKIYDLQNNQIIETNIDRNSSLIAWVDDDQLLIISRQSFSQTSSDTISFNPDLGGQIVIATFNPRDSLIKFIENSSALVLSGELLAVYPLQNGKEVFFQLDQGFFKIILEKL